MKTERDRLELCGQRNVKTHPHLEEEGNRLPTRDFTGSTALQTLSFNPGAVVICPRKLIPTWRHPSSSTVGAGQTSFRTASCRVLESRGGQGKGWGTASLRQLFPLTFPSSLPDSPSPVCSSEKWEDLPFPLELGRHFPFIVT